MYSMKGKLILLTILVLLFIGFVGIKFFILNTTNLTGRIKIITSPSTSVFIDNVAVGRTPYEDKQKVGEYILKLIPEGVATETASWQGKVKIYQNALTYVNRELGSTDISSAGEIFTITKMDKPANGPRGEISVDSDPTGAIVYLDNDEKGIAPLILENVVAGEHEISVYMPGFFRRTQKVNVEEGYRVNALFKLAVDQSQQSQQVLPTGDKVATPGAQINKIKVVIKDTPTGWLRVREEPTLDASESGKVNTGDEFTLLDEKEGWYKINFGDKNGWISSVYSGKK